MPSSAPNGIAVYCASSLGTQKAYQNAAISVGCAIASSSRSLVYGGGSKGLMGIVSDAVRENDGRVVGVVPYAMVAGGGEGSKPSDSSRLVEMPPASASGKVETIVVNSMHERKVEMTKRSFGFIALPGGFGTWEEVMEAVTWSQLGIHAKPIVVLNVLGFFEPLRALVRNGIEAGFIQPQNEHLLVFVDAPPNSTAAEQEVFDWGRAALEALEGWRPPTASAFSYDWTRKTPGTDGAPGEQDALEAT